MKILNMQIGIPQTCKNKLNQCKNNEHHENLWNQNQNHINNETHWNPYENQQTILKSYQSTWELCKY